MGAVRIRALAGGVAVTGLTSFALMMPATALGQVVTSASITESAASESATLESATFESATLESAATSQCQVVPGDAAPSASPSTPEGTGTTAPAPAPSGSAPAQADSDQAAAVHEAPAELCISVTASEANVKPGQAASYTVQVSAPNGPVSGVQVTLSAAPFGQATFTGLCPSGEGAVSCVVGSLDTDVTPSSFQLQAQIPADVAAGTTVTLTAAASAAASPPMTALPEAAASVSVAAAPAPSHSPAPSPSRTPGHSPAPTHTPGSQRPTPTPTGHPTGLPATPPASTPALGPVPAPPSILSTPSPLLPPATPGSITTVTNPGSIDGILPTIAPVPTAPPTPGVIAPSPAADITSDADGRDPAGSTAGEFTLVMPAATAEALGGIILALVVTLTTTRLVATSRLASRARPEAKKPATRRRGVRTGTRRFTIGRLKRPAFGRYLARRPAPKQTPEP